MTKREIIFDTETTGFDPFPKVKGGQKDRIVEIGAIEILDLKPTGRVFHKYINPERHIPEEVVKIHNIDDEKVKDCPTFLQIAQEWLDFIGDDSYLVAHNASFDMKFINAELLWAGKMGIEQNRVIDTLAMAKKKFPGQRNSLDALCNRFEIDNTKREYHGALLDSELLLDVYLELQGGKQRGFELNKDFSTVDTSDFTGDSMADASQFPKRYFPPSSQEKEKHSEFLKSHIKDALWNKKND